MKPTRALSVLFVLVLALAATSISACEDDDGCGELNKCPATTDAGATG